MAAFDPTPLNDALRRLHRASIVSLGLCGIAVGIVALAQGAGDFDPGASRWVAIALAAVAILARRSIGPGGRLRVFLYTTVASLVACVGLGVLGVFLATRGQPAVGALYALAAAILLLRPPPKLTKPKPRVEGEA
jgi:hypothetical protein